MVVSTHFYCGKTHIMVYSAMRHRSSIQQDWDCWISERCPVRVLPSAETAMFR